MYCNGDPVNGYDPSGHFSLEEIAKWSKENAHPILIVNFYYNSSTGFNGVGGFQKAIDPLASLYDPCRVYGEQSFLGFGVSAGAGAGGGIIITGEEGAEVNRYGRYISISGGASLEGHVNMVQTFGTNYPIENYVNIFLMLQQML